MISSLLQSRTPLKQIIMTSIFQEYVLNFDGCCKGNPGPGGAGAVIYHNGHEIWSGCSFLGKNVTNNMSEYSGLIIGMREASRLDIQNLVVKGDSQLVIRQMMGQYNVNSDNLINLHNEAKALEKYFDAIIYKHVYRKDNARADKLSNDGLLRCPN